MSLHINPYALLAVGFLSVSAASNAEAAQAQTYAAVRQALLDGHTVTMTLDAEDTHDCTGLPPGIAHVAVPKTFVEDSSYGQFGQFSRIRFREMHSEVVDMNGPSDWGNRKIVDKYASYALVGPASGGDYVVVSLVEAAHGEPTGTTISEAINCRFGTGAKFSW
ncbi:MAG TPA: hypothetical protein VIM98_04320 [Dyella sp.]|uniref:hypothetical protein n=1 Tax=Dyella sp. TaxID=1869338 RepID=UPI002F954650